MNNSDLNNLENPAEQGSFMVGFTLGIFAGAAGYYLFATENGEKLRKKLTKEWEEAKANMIEEGVIVNNKISLREFLHEFFINTLNTSLPTSLMNPTAKGKKLSRPSSKVKKFGGNRFKGV